MPRRDVERLHQILTLQPRLMDLRAPFKAQRSLLHRHVINDALTWLEIHGERPEVLAHWRGLQAEPMPGTPVPDGTRRHGSPAGRSPLRAQPPRRRSGAVAAGGPRPPSREESRGPRCRRTSYGRFMPSWP